MIIKIKDHYTLEEFQEAIIGLSMDFEVYMKAGMWYVASPRNKRQFYSDGGLIRYFINRQISQNEAKRQLI